MSSVASKAKRALGIVMLRKKNSIYSGPVALVKNKINFLIFKKTFYNGLMMIVNKLAWKKQITC